MAALSDIHVQTTSQPTIRISKMKDMKKQINSRCRVIKCELLLVVSHVFGCYYFLEFFTSYLPFIAHSAAKELLQTNQGALIKTGAWTKNEMKGNKRIYIFVYDTASVIVVVLVHSHRCMQVL